MREYPEYTPKVGPLPGYPSQSMSSTVAGTMTPRSTLGSPCYQVATDVVLRAEEWEREIESLDRKEMEIHQTQLRLIREQTASLSQELLAMRHDVKELKVACARHTGLHGDLSSLVEARLAASDCGLHDLGDSVMRHEALHQDLDRRLAQLSGNLEEQKRAASQHITMKERMEYLERAVGDSAGKHQRQLEEASAKLEHLHARVSGCESGHGELKRWASEKDGKHASMADRVAYLEKLAGDSAEKHLRELDAFRAAHEGHMQATKAKHGSIEQTHASMESRLNYLEGVVGDSADQHAKELEAMKASLGELASGIQAHGTVAQRLGDSMVALNAAHSTHSNGTRDMLSKHATIESRLEYIEKAIGDSADRHAVALAKLEQLHGRVSEEQKERQQHIGDLKSSKDRLAKDHASLEERMTYLENLAGDSADRHARELENLKSSHERHAQDARSKHGSVEQMHASIKSRLEYLESMVGDSADRHAAELKAMKASMDELASGVASHGGIAQRLGESVAALSAAHGTHSNSSREFMSKHASIESRLEYIETTIGDSADKHAIALAKLDQLHGKLSDEQKERQQHIGDLKSNKDKLARDHASLEERIAYVENMVGDSADRHARELEQVKGSHAKLASEGNEVKARHASLEERLGYMESWVEGFRRR